MQTTKYIGMHAKCGLERSFMNDQQHNKIYSEKKKKTMHCIIEESGMHW